MKIIFSIIMLMVGTICIGQNIKPSNIFYRTIGDTIEIYYDLPRNADTLNIKVYFRKKSDPKFRYRIQHARGSIGTGVFSGTNKKVVWLYKKEPSHLFTGDGFYFEVVVRKIKRKVVSPV